MPSYQTLLSDGIGFLIAALYTLAGQAHFTSQFTPDLAASIEEMTPNSLRGFGLGLEYLPFKYTLGAFDLLGALLLWRKRTRRAGFITAIFGFAGGLYGQYYSCGDLSQVGGLLGLAVLGLLLAPRRL